SPALVDGHNGMGQVAGDYAMRLAIAKARAHDLAAVAVRNSNHYGIAGYYAMLALEHDLIGLSLTNSSPLVAPTGGRRAMVGTNPIAVAVPTGDGRPFVLDMATSTVPVGRLEVHARKGLPLQPGWAVDAAGKQTLDAAAGRAGALLPLGGTALTGGYKGYGLGVMIDLLAGEKEWRAHDDARLHGVQLYHTVVHALDELGRRFNLGPLPARDETP